MFPWKSKVKVGLSLWGAGTAQRHLFYFIPVFRRCTHQSTLAHTHKRVRDCPLECVLLYLSLRHTIHHFVDHCTLSPKAHNKTDIGRETKKEAEEGREGWGWRLLGVRWFTCVHVCVRMFLWRRKQPRFLLHCVWSDEFKDQTFFILSGFLVHTVVHSSFSAFARTYTSGHQPHTHTGSLSCIKVKE